MGKRRSVLRSSGCGQSALGIIIARAGEGQLDDGAAVPRDRVDNKGFRLQRGAGGFVDGLGCGGLLGSGSAYCCYALHLLTLYTVCAANTLHGF